MPRKGTGKTQNSGNGKASQTPNVNEPQGGPNNEISNEEVAARAYEIYVREGRVEGRDLDHWLRAEAELRNERKASSQPPAERKSTAARSLRGREERAAPVI